MGIDAWQVLVHVCRRWRNLVFRSPRRLNLQLLCTPRTPAKDKLDVWPALPLIVLGDMIMTFGTDDVIAALGQSNRVCGVSLWLLARWQLEKVLAAMQVPFPALTELWLSSLHDETLMSAIPDSFLGGSAKSLQYFRLNGIPFPGMPKLLRSATHLVQLSLTSIPHSGYISPEVMVTFLSALSSLLILFLEFESPQSRPDWQSLPPPKCSILPALKEFHFKGVTEYLEELVTRIDTPQLDRMLITFFNQIDFDCPRLVEFINCTPTLRALDEARAQFFDSTAYVNLRYRTSQSGLDGLTIAISCGEPDWQLSSIEQFCNSSLHPISTVEDLYIIHPIWEPVLDDDAVMKTLWLELLSPFTAVKNLYLRKRFAPNIAAALEELVGGRITEVLPSLESIFVERLGPSGTFQKSIGQFVTARQLSDHPIAISDWHYKHNYHIRPM